VRTDTSEVPLDRAAVVSCVVPRDGYDTITVHSDGSLTLADLARRAGREIGGTSFLNYLTAGSTGDSKSGRRDGGRYGHGGRELCPTFRVHVDAKLQPCPRARRREIAALCAIRVEPASPPTQHHGEAMEPTRHTEQKASHERCRASAAQSGQCARYRWRSARMPTTGRLVSGGDALRRALFRSARDYRAFEIAPSRAFGKLPVAAHASSRTIDAAAPSWMRAQRTATGRFTGN
jgi:hypothetical protein